jgi:hypothetical protein
VSALFSNVRVLGGPHDAFRYLHTRDTQNFGPRVERRVDGVLLRKVTVAPGK